MRLSIAAARILRKAKDSVPIINGPCNCEALVFADEDGLLRELVLLPHGAGSIAEGDGWRGRRSNLPEGTLALREAVSAGAEQALLCAHRSGTGMLGIAGQAKGLGLTVDYGRARGLSPGQRGKKEEAQPTILFHRKYLHFSGTSELIGHNPLVENACVGAVPICASGAHALEGSK